MAKDAVTYVPGEDPATLQANQVYRDSLQKLMESLEGRKKPMFDPTMLAMARGFLKPTQTGGFGESLGNVAEALIPAQEAETKREQEYLAQKLGLAGKQLELQQQVQSDKELQEIIKRRSGAGQPAGGLPTTQAAPVAPQANAPAGGLPVAPRRATLAEPPPPLGPEAAQGSFSDLFPGVNMEGGMLSSIPLPATDTAGTPVRRGEVAPIAQGMGAPAGGASPQAPAPLPQPVGDAAPIPPVQPSKDLTTAPTVPSTIPLAPAQAPTARVAPSPERVEPAPERVAQAGPAAQPQAASPTGVQGFQLTEPDRNWLSGTDYLLSARNDRTKSNAEKLKIASDLDKDRVVVKENGLYDRASGMFYPFPKGERQERDLFDRNGNHLGSYDLTGDQYTRLDLYAQNNDPRFFDVVDEVRKGPRISRAGAQQDGEGRLSKSQSALRNKTQEIIATKRAERQAAGENEIYANMDASGDTLTNARLFKQFASAPDAKDIFGLFQTKGVFAALGSLAESGVGGPGFSIGIPEIQKVLRNAGLKDDQIAKYEAFAQISTQNRLKMAQYAKGAISNFEQGLFKQASVTPDDNPTTIIMKSDLMEARANFDRQAGRMFDDALKNNPTLSVEQFKRTSAYQEMRDNYDKQLAKIASGEYSFSAGRPAASRPAGGQAGGRNLEGARKRVDDILK